MTARKIFLTKAQDVAEGRVGFFSVGERSVSLLKRDGKFYAFENRCSHDDGPLGQGSLLDENLIECPRHGARFDLTTGKAVRMPAVAPIEVYPIEIHNDEIWIALPDKDNDA